MEQLESRMMLTLLTAFVEDGTLTVLDDASDNTIGLSLNADGLVQVDDGNDGVVEYTFDPDDSFIPFAAISIQGGRGNDGLAIDVEGTGLIGMPIDFDGGMGHDSILLVGTPTAGSADTTYTPGPMPTTGRLVVDDGNTYMTVEFDGLEPVVDLIPGQLLVNGNGADNAIDYRESPDANGLISIDDFETIEFNNKAELVISAGAGNDVIHLNSEPLGLAPVTVIGGGPRTLDTLIVSGSDENDTLEFVPMGLEDATVHLNTQTINITEISELVFDGAQGNDMVNVVAAGVDPSIVNLDPGATSGSGKIQVDTRLPLSFENVGQGEIEIADHDSAGTELIYGGTASSDVFVVGRDSTVNGGPRVTLNRGLVVGTTGISSLTLRGIGGDDTFHVQAPLPLQSVNLVGDGGRDVVQITTPTDASSSLAFGVQEDVAGAQSLLGTGAMLNTVSLEQVIVSGDGDDSLTINPGAGAHEILLKPKGLNNGDQLSVQSLPDIQWSGLQALTIDTSSVGPDIVTVAMESLAGAEDYQLIGAPDTSLKLLADSAAGHAFEIADGSVSVSPPLRDRCGSDSEVTLHEASVVLGHLQIQTGPGADFISLRGDQLPPLQINDSLQGLGDQVHVNVPFSILGLATPAFLIASPPADPGTDKVVWYGTADPSLQDAIDQVNDGGTVCIVGAHTVDPVYVTDKHVTIVGDGQNAKLTAGQTSNTELAVINVSDDGTVAVQNLSIDANSIVGIGAGSAFLPPPDASSTVGAKPPANNPTFPYGQLAFTPNREPRIVLDDVEIVNAAFGVQSAKYDVNIVNSTINNSAKSAVQVTLGHLSLFQSKVEGAGEHAIHLLNSAGHCHENRVVDSSVRDADGAGIFAQNSGLCVIDSFVGFNQYAGIRADQSAISVTNTTVNHNRVAGMWTEDSWFEVADSNIQFNYTATNGLYGDGIAAVRAIDGSGILNTTIDFSARASLSVFGGSVWVSRSELLRDAIDISVEDGGHVSQIGEYLLATLPGPIAPKKEIYINNNCGLPGPVQVFHQQIVKSEQDGRYRWNYELSGNYKECKTSSPNIEAPTPLNAQSEGESTPFNFSALRFKPPANNDLQIIRALSQTLSQSTNPAAVIVSPPSGFVSDDGETHNVSHLPTQLVIPTETARTVAQFDPFPDEPMAGNVSLGNANVSITQTDSADPTSVEGLLTYTLTAANAGPDDAKVVVIDHLPPNSEFVSASTECAYYQPKHKVVCNAGSLAAGDSAVISIVVSPASTGIMTNTATILQAQADDDLAKNVVEETTIVLPFADAGGPYAVAAGDYITLDGFGSAGTVAFLHYSWDFNEDGSFDDAVGRHPVFDASTLQAGDVIDVALRVSDGVQSSDAMTSIEILPAVNQPPVIEVLDIPETATAGNRTTAEVFLTDVDYRDGALTVMFDWGDGTPVDVATARYHQGGWQASANHTFEDPGDYSVQVTVRDEEGATSSETQLINIRDLSQTLLSLDHEYGFRFAGSYYEDWGNRSEKWFQDRERNWYFILPNGQLFRWDSSNRATGEVIAILTPSVHDAPALLHDAVESQPIDPESEGPTGLLPDPPPFPQAISSWTNPLNELDVNGDLSVTPVDALIIINELNDAQVTAAGVLPAQPSPSYFFDPNNDGFVSPLDVLWIVNFLIAPIPFPEGESSVVMTSSHSVRTERTALEVIPTPATDRAIHPVIPPSLVEKRLDHVRTAAAIHDLALADYLDDYKSSTK